MALLRLLCGEFVNADFSSKLKECPKVKLALTNYRTLRSASIYASGYTFFFFYFIVYTDKLPSKHLLINWNVLMYSVMAGVNNFIILYLSSSQVSFENSYRIFATTEILTHVNNSN